MAKKSKYYVVWQGRRAGVFHSWDACKEQIEGFAGAKYKSFESLSEANKAFEKPAQAFIGTTPKPTAKPQKLNLVGKPIENSLSVDAAWNTASGDMEYQGVITKTKQLIFKQGPFQDGTNNIGEFLAIVHALAFLKRENSDLPIYSDSKTAISWVKKKQANTKLAETPRNKVLFELLERAEKWLRDNEYTNKILKWETEFWGENPADFGRK
ncbi:MAG: ribonuclease H family protein [Spirosomataceae bacterium]